MNKGLSFRTPLLSYDEFILERDGPMKIVSGKVGIIYIISGKGGFK